MDSYSKDKDIVTHLLIRFSQPQRYDDKLHIIDEKNITKEVADTFRIRMRQRAYTQAWYGKQRELTTTIAGAVRFTEEVSQPDSTLISSDPHYYDSIMYMYNWIYYGYGKEPMEYEDDIFKERLKFIGSHGEMPNITLEKMYDRRFSEAKHLTEYYKELLKNSAHIHSLSPQEHYSEIERFVYARREFLTLLRKLKPKRMVYKGQSLAHKIEGPHIVSYYLDNIEPLYSSFFSVFDNYEAKTDEDFTKMQELKAEFYAREFIY